MNSKNSEKMLRVGPRPLMTHLGLTLSGHMHAGSAKSLDDVSLFLEGIRKYQTYDFTREETAYDVMWASAGARVLRINNKENYHARGHVFLLPSLINRYTIFDLLPEQSFAQWLAQSGYDVYILDWGNPTNEKTIESLDHIYSYILNPALDCIQAVTNTPVHLMGYCMGGTIAAGYCALNLHECQSLTLIATPWDFQSGAGKLEHWVKFWAPAGLHAIAQNGYLPSSWMQNVFASLDPFQMQQKFSDFTSANWNVEKERIFVCVEDWLNDGVDLPGQLAYTCIRDWFLNNKPCKGEWTVLGTPVIPEHIQCPTLVVASKEDRLVPYTASQCFQALQTEYLEAQCGHIGYMASTNSKKKLWPKIATFLEGKTLL